MNTIPDNNFSFKANFETKIEILKPLGKYFSKISKGNNGTLSIYRKAGELFASDGKSSVCVDEELSKYFTIASSTEKDTKNYAKKALNTLRLLQAETLYQNYVDSITRNKSTRSCRNFNKFYNAYQKQLNKLSSKSLAPFIYEELKGAI